MQYTVHIRYRAGGGTIKNWPYKQYGLISNNFYSQINKWDQKIGQTISLVPDGLVTDMYCIRGKPLCGSGNIIAGKEGP